MIFIKPQIQKKIFYIEESSASYLPYVSVRYLGSHINRESRQTGTQDKRDAKLFAESEHSNRRDIGAAYQI
jgi:hypothetical protein